MTFPVFPGSNPSGYNLTRSVRLRASASAYLNRTPASAGNRQIFTISWWCKRGSLSAESPLFTATDGTNRFYSRFETNDTISVYFYTGGAAYDASTSAVYRDPSAWYHIVIAVDTTQATAANRLKIYVNGVQQTITTSVPQNTSTMWNNTVQQNIGKKDTSGTYIDGYFAEVYSIDGQALTPSSFGSTNTLTGVWQPARYTGTYGTNGFYLPFTDNSALTTSSNVGLGKDFSGNGNYWTTNNISITAGTTYDSMTDVPTLTSATAANYCVMNPIDTSGTGSTGISITGGNLNLAGASSDWGAARATFGMTSGKWYWECTRTGASSVMFGIGLNSTTLTYAYTSTSYSYFSTGDKYSNNVSAAYGASFASGDVIGVAFDADAGTLTFYKNNVSQGTAYTGLTSGPYFPLNQNYTTTGTASINFGQRPFAYTPPTGYVALNTYNLPTSTIVKGNTVMDATLYTGTNATLTVTNAGAFKPDLVWVKTRSVASRNTLFDSVRGNTKVLWSDSTDAEGTATGGTGLTAFNSNGFSLGTEIAGTSGSTNSNAVTYVGWQWQAGQGTTSSNTSGTITSTVSVNASAGFSIVTYTGSSPSGTVGHGLGVAPSLIIVKQRNTGGNNWPVWVSGVTSATQFLFLNTTAAIGTSTNYWNSTAPTSSVFSVGNDSATNTTGATYVAYCWTPIAGYSAFGSYTGNGSSDGPFVYTGFRPKFVLAKRSDSGAYDWFQFDTARETYNVMYKHLKPNGSNAEDTGVNPFLDVVSNGFKLRTANNMANASGGTYIYMAFAENPTKFALAR